MYKWCCTDCSERCTVTSPGDALPKYCMKRTIMCGQCRKVSWQMVKQEPEAEKRSDLPKLTKDVFYHNDCPLWAQVAAVDRNGKAHLFTGVMGANHGEWIECDGKIKDIPGEWDASSWENSLVTITPLMHVFRTKALYDLERLSNELLQKTPYHFTSHITCKKLNITITTKEF